MVIIKCIITLQQSFELITSNNNAKLKFTNISLVGQ